MPAETSPYTLRLASSASDVLAAKRLRYRVFVRELGATGPLINHTAQTEEDAFDQIADHMILIDNTADPTQGDHVIGAYRLLPSDRLPPGQPFYSEAEFDLSPLRQSNRRLLELGRSCVHPDHRGGTAMFHLWNGLAAYILDRNIEILFGTASFHGTDTTALAMPLSWLGHHHLAPPDMRVTARPDHSTPLTQIPAADLDRSLAMAAMPALIKAYLRLGGYVGDGAWVDHAFNTIDVCLVMDTARMSAKHRDFYLRKQGSP